MNQAQAVGKNGLIPSCVELSNGLEFQLLIDLYLSLVFETPTCIISKSVLLKLLFKYDVNLSLSVWTKKSSAKQLFA